jgi:hypothetical protein
MSEQDALQALLATRRLYRRLRPHLPGALATRPEDAAQGPLFPRHDGSSYKLSLARMEAIEDALRAGAAVDERMREEILGLIAHVARLHDDDAKPKQRSHFMSAATVLVLRERHGLSLKEALSAVVPDSLRGTELSACREAIRKAAERLQKSGQHVLVLESWVERALQRHNRLSRTKREA